MAIKNNYLREITLQSLRDFILDSNFTEEDSIYLHPYNFDEIVIQYRSYYGKPVTGSIIHLGVFVHEDLSGQVPVGRVGVGNV